MNAEPAPIRPDLDRARLMADAHLSEQLAAAYGQHSRALTALVDADVMPNPPEVKGPVQKRMFSIPELFTDHGMAAGAIARHLDYDEANVYTVLNSLMKAGNVELVEGATPRRYRMTIKHRRDRILRMSRLVPEGRWTTYGDFSIAVYDNWRMAITIGRVASRHPAFVAPHRVIWSGGVVKDGWQDDDGRGPEECIRRLGKEGVSFVDGKADPDKYIGWQDLQQLLEADEARDQLDDAA
jgi:alkylated DNA nucleotide flippase Atl1